MATDGRNASIRAGFLAALITGLALLALAFSAERASAALEITEFSGIVADAKGDTYNQAAGHPYSATTTIRFGNEKKGLSTVPKESIKDMQVDLPPGFAGDPTATPTRCTAQQLTTSVQIPGGFYSLCPDSSQVGVVKLYFAPPFLAAERSYGVFNMETRPGAPAQFGFMVDSGALQTPIMFTATVRPDDYGVRVNVTNTPQPLAVLGTSLTFWGVPADSSHDPQRGRCLKFDGTSTGLCPIDAPDLPFLTNPSNCAAGPLTTTLKANSWQSPNEYAIASFDTDVKGNPTAVANCEAVPFDADISVRPNSQAADSPTGLDVELTMPQPSNAAGKATGYLKRAEVTLPGGVAVNAASAGGLGACSPAQIGLGTDAPPSCPANSKLGTVEIETPLLEDPLQGSVYLASQKDNPFGSLLALYLVAEGSGVIVKLPGKIVANEQSGQITATFDDNPQLPFETLRVRFFDGPRASLTTPTDCGTYAATARFSPWSAADPNNPTAAETVVSSSSFEVSSGPGGRPCSGAGFSPNLDAGTVNPIAGDHSPFVLRLTREDGSQRLSTIAATLPEGLLGKLAGIPYCPDAALAGISGAEGTGAAQLSSPSCPAASQIGRVTVGAGAGPDPFYVETGRAYLAGPYKGAPLSVAFVTPALAGPFDLGSVLVRAALQVNSRSAQVTAVSDPLPSILYGIPLDLRDVRVNLDRSQFTLNPTSCDPMQVATTVRSTTGATAHPSARFQAAGCERLPFKPQLALRLKGSTKRSGYPALTATLTQKPGANIERASVAMPRSEFLAQNHIRTVCTRVQFAANECPSGSVYGSALAFSPLLDKPLEGPVYLRSSSNPLPDLVADLNGQIRIELVGRIDSFNGGIRTTFTGVPDAPVSKFVLKMQGGKKGLLENSRNLCKGKNRATVKLDAHSGRASDYKPVVTAAGCKKGKRK